MALSCPEHIIAPPITSRLEKERERERDFSYCSTVAEHKGFRSWNCVMLHGRYHEKAGGLSVTTVQQFVASLRWKSLLPSRHSWNEAERKSCRTHHSRWCIPVQLLNSRAWWLHQPALLMDPDRSSYLPNTSGLAGMLNGWNCCITLGHRLAEHSAHWERRTDGDQSLTVGAMFWKLKPASIMLEKGSCVKLEQSPPFSVVLVRVTTF